MYKQLCLYDEIYIYGLFFVFRDFFIVNICVGKEVFFQKNCQNFLFLLQDFDVKDIEYIFFDQLVIFLIIFIIVFFCIYIGRGLLKNYQQSFNEICVFGNQRL